MLIELIIPLTLGKKEQFYLHTLARFARFSRKATCKWKQKRLVNKLLTLRSYLSSADLKLTYFLLMAASATWTAPHITPSIASGRSACIKWQQKTCKKSLKRKTLSILTLNGQSGKYLNFHSTATWVVPNVNATLSAVYADLREANVCTCKSCKNKILQKSGLHEASTTQAGIYRIK